MKTSPFRSCHYLAEDYTKVLDLRRNEFDLSGKSDPRCPEIKFTCLRSHLPPAGGILEDERVVGEDRKRD